MIFIAEVFFARDCTLFIYKSGFIQPPKVISDQNSQRFAKVQYERKFPKLWMRVAPEQDNFKRRSLCLVDLNIRRWRLHLWQETVLRFANRHVNFFSKTGSPLPSNRRSIFASVKNSSSKNLVMLSKIAIARKYCMAEFHDNLFRKELPWLLAQKLQDAWKHFCLCSCQKF